MLTRSSSPCLLIATLLLALLPTGCDEDTTCQPCATSTILGEVTGAGKPLEARISAHELPFEGGLHIYARAEAETDSTGRYVLGVPPGRYVLRLHVEDLGRIYFAYDGTLSSQLADTISVAEGSDPVTVHVRLGAVRLRLDTPPEWESLAVRARLHPDTGDPRLYSTVAASENGSVEILFPAVIPASYRASIQSQADKHSFWLPATHTQTEADWIEVGSAAETLYETQIPSPATFAGQIVGSWQELLLPPPQILLVDANSTTIARGHTGYNGDFSLWVYEPLKIRLFTSITNIQRWHGGDSFEDAAEFDLQLGQQTDVEIVESGIAGFLEGQGYRYADLYRDDGSRLGRTNIADIEGLFSFANLIPGTYRVHFVSSPSWPSFWYDEAESIDTATPVEITEEGEVVWITPTRVEGGSISGEILDPAGEPVRTALLTLSSSNRRLPSLRSEFVGGEDGGFEISGLANGSYKLGAAAGSFLTIWYPGTADWDSAAVITVEGWQDVTGITIQFPE